MCSTSQWVIVARDIETEEMWVVGPFISEKAAEQYGNWTWCRDVDVSFESRPIVGI
jgi:hypothetical protein